MRQSKNLNSPYIIFSKEEWADLGFGATLNLTENEIIELRGLNEPMSIDEVRDVYLPISRLLNLYISGTEKLFEATNLLSEYGINMNKCHLIKNKSELQFIFNNKKNKKFVMKFF